MAGIFSKYCEIVELGFSCALRDRLEVQLVQVEEKPSYKREAALEGQEATPEKWDNSLSNPGQMGGRSTSSLGLPKIHGKRSLGKDALLAVRHAAI